MSSTMSVPCIRRVSTTAVRDPAPLAIVGAGLALLYLPTYWDLARSLWATSDQGLGPFILLGCLYLFAERRAELAALRSAPRPIAGGALVTLGLCAYVVGRSQSIWLLEVGSQIPVVVGVLLLFRGWRGLRLCWIPTLLLLFMVPLPAPLVASLTGPLKAGASYVAAELLFHLGYPVSRTGVILSIGPYLVLVADACAGLNSMFTLESVGLFYLAIVRHPSRLHNVIVSMSLMPIAFVANVVRVVVLVLVTYHLGDAAGRGFLHVFAGSLLFLVALALIVPLDKLVCRAMRGCGVPV